MHIISPTKHAQLIIITDIILTAAQSEIAYKISLEVTVDETYGDARQRMKHYMIMATGSEKAWIFISPRVYFVSKLLII